MRFSLMSQVGGAARSVPKPIAILMARRHLDSLFREEDHAEQEDIAEILSRLEGPANRG
jgi:hypothetical protein